MIPETIDHNLSEAELASIAKLLVYWSAVDLILARALAIAESVDEKEFRDLAKLKHHEIMERLNIALGGGRLDEDCRLPLAELAACKVHRDSRHRYAHGVVGRAVNSAKAGALTIRGERSDLEDLPRDFEWAKYALGAAQCVFASVLGQRHQVNMPEKPVA